MTLITVKAIRIGKLYHVKNGNLSVIVHSHDALAAIGKAYDYVYGGRTTI